MNPTNQKAIKAWSIYGTAGLIIFLISLYTFTRWRKEERAKEGVKLELARADGPRSTNFFVRIERGTWTESIVLNDGFEDKYRMEELSFVQTAPNVWLDARFNSNGIAQCEPINFPTGSAIHADGMGKYIQFRVGDATPQHITHATVEVRIRPKFTKP